MIRLFALMLLLASFGGAAGEQKTGRLTEVIVPEGAAYAVVDVMDGVEARYRLMEYGDDYGEYSCAGYVKAYYMAVYGVNVQNLADTGPLTPSDMLARVDTPQRGDIIFYASPPHKNNHSAIVKAFDGTRITLIEQNFKWAQNGGTYTYLDRTIDWSPNGNDYQIWRYSPAALEQEAGSQTGLSGNDLYPSDTAESGGLTSSPDDDAGYGESPPPITEPEEAPPVTEPEYPDAVGQLPFTEPEYPDAVEQQPFTEPEYPTFAEQTPVTEPETSVTPEPDYNPAPVFVALVTIGGSSINVNGWDMPIDAPALIENNRTVLPVRFVSYALGLASDDVKWDEATRTVSVFNNGNMINFEVDSDVLYVNGHPTQMDCPAFIRNNYTYLPLKYLAEALNAFYEWDEGQRTVRLFR
jgi:hypothetical protein